MHFPILTLSTGRLRSKERLAGDEHAEQRTLQRRSERCVAIAPGVGRGVGGLGSTNAGAACCTVADHNSACTGALLDSRFQPTPHVSAAINTACTKMARPIALPCPVFVGGVNSGRSDAKDMMISGIYNAIANSKFAQKAQRAECQHVAACP